MADRAVVRESLRKLMAPKPDGSPGLTPDEIRTMVRGNALKRQGFQPAKGGGYERPGAPVVDHDAMGEEPSFTEEIGTRLKEVGQGFKALGTAARHPLDTLTNDARRRQLLRGVDDSVTLGYGQKLADAMTPGAYSETMGGKEEADQREAPEFRTGGAILGAPLGGATKVGAAGGAKLAGKVIKGPGLTKNVGRSVLGYEAAAPAATALHASSEGRRLEAAKDAATDPLGVPAAIAGGALRTAVGDAPKRAAKSEVAGLKEGVQYKTRVQKFEPNEAQIAAELDRVPEVRRLIKIDPEKAQVAVERQLKNVSDADLNPFYEQMKAAGRDGVDAERFIGRLRKLQGEFDPYAEEGQIAVIENLIQKMEADASKSGGVLPAGALRKSATAFQNQGYANLPMFGQIQLSKAAKQGIGGALRSAIADHVEGLADNTASGKALSQAFRDANRRVSTWATIQDIIDEKAKRVSGNALPMGDVVNAAARAVNSPVATAVGIVPKAADVVDRRILAPAVRSGPGRAVAPLGAAAVEAGPALNPLLEATRRDRERQKRQKETLMRSRR